jgi:hypothetical protein
VILPFLFFFLTVSCWEIIFFTYRRVASYTFAFDFWNSGASLLPQKIIIKKEMKTRVKRNNLIQKNELDSNGSIDKSPPPQHHRHSWQLGNHAVIVQYRPRLEWIISYVFIYCVHNPWEKNKQTKEIRKAKKKNMNK